MTLNCVLVTCIHMKRALIMDNGANFNGYKFQFFLEYSSIFGVKNKEISSLRKETEKRCKYPRAIGRYCYNLI